MRVIGVSLGHDSNCCLVEDGKIIRYAAEERFSRLKAGVNGAVSSFKYCLGDYRVEDIDKVCISDIMSSKAVQAHYQALFRCKTTIMPLLVKQSGYQINTVVNVDHHECHAGSAYYTSGFNDALIVSVDGIGGNVTQYVGEGVGGKIRALGMVKDDGVYQRGMDGMFRIKRFKAKRIYSWGWFYGMVTEGLGWRMITDEGKTMGLSPYGDASKVPGHELRRHMYSISPDSYYHNNGLVYYHFAGANAYQEMAVKYGRENLAAAAQRKLEEKVLNFVRRWLRRTGHKNLCVVGGVFLNVKLNQRIHEAFPDVNFWPFPLASDTGLSVGAALLEYYKVNEYKPERIANLYWGEEHSDESIEALLVRNKLAYRPYDETFVAKALAANKIVAWFQGRMEGGPRALGGRSILMSPLRAENKDIINRTVKFRESFRPFCPSVPIDDADRYFDGGNEYMIISCNVKSEAIPAVTHVDNTARPQLLRRPDNQVFYDLLKTFGRLTGHPVLLNTSLNVMGEPICRTPTDAIKCFFSVGLDILVLGKSMLVKGEHL